MEFISLKNFVGSIGKLFINTSSNEMSVRDPYFTSGFMRTGCRSQITTPTTPLGRTVVRFPSTRHVVGTLPESRPESYLPSLGPLSSLILSARVSGLSGPSSRHPDLPSRIPLIKCHKIQELTGSVEFSSKQTSVLLLKVLRNTS